MENMIVWADIPVTDLQRATKFYSAVLQHPFITMDGMPWIALPGPEGSDSSAAQQGPMPVLFDLALGENQKPSTQGCTIYLNSYGDPEGMLRRVAEAGGQILVPVTDRGEMVGRIGFFQDTEGNRIGVHQPPQR
jgi:predicted enzyme related to lactoylglutathione lyase